MKNIPKLAVLVVAIVLMLVMDLPFLHWIDQAEAIAGVRRRTARRTAVVVGGTTAAYAGAATAAASQEAAYSQQQAAQANAEAAAAQQQAAAAEAQADSYKQQAASAQAAAQAAGVLPIGTVVTTLPAGCSPVTSGGVEYQQCGGNYYRAAFQGSQLVYVTAQP